MRIGIVCQRLFRKQKSGMEVAVLGWINALCSLGKEHEFFLFVRPDVDRGSLEVDSNLHIVFVEASNYLTWEQVQLPSVVKKYQLDLLHCTSNTAPLFCKIPLILTLHDLTFMENIVHKGQATLYQKMGRWYRQNLVPRIAPKATQIITVSNFSKKEIIQKLEIDKARIQVIPNAVASDFRPPAGPGPRLEIKNKYNLPERFFLYLGNLAPKKNMIGMLRAFAEFSPQEPDCYLLITAMKKESVQKVLEQIDQAELINKIVLSGYIEHKYLPAIYAIAEGLIYPSFHEGFGLPLLEAFACGTAVISSQNTALPEVAGGAAQLIDPADSHTIAEAMLKLSRDETYRKILISRGLERVLDFSWQKTAQQILDCYEK